MIGVFQLPLKIMDVINNIGFLVGIVGFILATVSLIYALKVRREKNEAREESIKSESDEIIELISKDILSSDISDRYGFEFFIRRAAALMKKDESSVLELLNTLLVQLKCQAEKLIKQIKQKQETISGETITPEHAPICKKPVSKMKPSPK